MGGGRRAVACALGTLSASVAASGVTLLLSQLNTFSIVVVVDVVVVVVIVVVIAFEPRKMAEKEVVLFDSPAVSVVKPVVGEEEEVVDVGDVRYVTIAMVEFVDNVVEGVVVILSVESVSNNVLSSIRSF